MRLRPLVLLLSLFLAAVSIAQASVDPRQQASQPEPPKTAPSEGIMPISKVYDVTIKDDHDGEVGRILVFMVESSGKTPLELIKRTSTQMANEGFLLPNPVDLSGGNDNPSLIVQDVTGRIAEKIVLRAVQGRKDQLVMCVGIRFDGDIHSAKSEQFFRAVSGVCASIDGTP